MNLKYDVSNRSQIIDCPMTPSWVNMTYDPGPHLQPVVLTPRGYKIIDALANLVEVNVTDSNVDNEPTGDEPVVIQASPPDPTR